MAVYRLRTPLREEDVRRLKVGDTVYLTGAVFTMRDQAHRRVIQYLKAGRALPFDPSGLALYHCGPIVRRLRNGNWRIISAGPTTSLRMEDYESEVIERLGVRLIIGKGGMGPKTCEALKRCGAVYASFVGGAAVLAAESIRAVEGVEWLDLGVPEAIWLLRVEDFGPLTISMDSHGENLYLRVIEEAERKLREIFSS